MRSWDFRPLKVRLTGRTRDGVYIEICEIRDHPWFLGCQFHPKFKSRPLEPHPLFTAFIGAAVEHRARRSQGIREQTRQVTHAS